ncbi:MAG: hypothetical protein EAX95_14370 [Candidatus Thorarchaeota archaeon]|nr:hypothetical protein [Candidatus Thorarchaeota archaeon]
MRNLQGSQRKTLLLFVCISLVSFGLLQIAPFEVAAATLDYQEDFDDTAFMDAAETNASIWGKDSLRIAPFEAEYTEGVLIEYGDYQDRYIDGTTLYVIYYGGTGIDVFDISDPAHPSKITSIAGLGYHIAANGDWMYVSRLYNLFIYNITDIMNPILVDTKGAGSGDIVIDGSNLYLGTPFDGILIYDITDPTAVVSIANYTGPDDKGFNTIEKRGDYLFALEMGSSLSGLQIINVTDNANPTFVSRCITPGTSYNLYLHDEYAFASSGNDLVVISISDLSNPSIISSAWFEGPTFGRLYVDDEFAFSMSTTYGLLAMDIRNVYDLHPAVINSDALGRILVLGSYVYVFSSDELEVYELHWAYSADAVSTTIYTAPGANFTIAHATLTVNDTIGADTSIDYYLSADNGVHWEEVESGAVHSFTNKGTQLKWKAELRTTTPMLTPVLYEVNVTIKALLDPPLPDEPWPLSGGYNICRITWDALDGAVDYLVQVDTVNTFDSPSLINETIGSDCPYSFCHYDTPALANGTYYFRVAGIDGEGDIGMFSSVGTMTIGTTSTTTTTTTTTLLPPIDPMNLIIAGAIGVIAIVAVVFVVQRRK